MPTDTPTGAEETADDAFTWGSVLQYCWMQLWKLSCYLLSEEQAGSFHFWLVIIFIPCFSPQENGSALGLHYLLIIISTNGLDLSLSHTEISLCYLKISYPRQLQTVRPISLSRWTYQHYHHCGVSVRVMVGQIANIVFVRELDAEGECVVAFSSHASSCSCTAVVVVSGERERGKQMVIASRCIFGAATKELSF